MVVERKSKSFASLACVGRGRIATWENGSSAGHWRFYMGNAMTQLARTLDVRHAVSATTSLAKAAEAFRYLVEGRPFGRVLLTI